MTIALAPADIRKEGTAFDLPIAIGPLDTQGFVTVQGHEGYLLAGELSLEGALRPVRGVLPQRSPRGSTASREVVNFLRRDKEPECVTVDVAQLFSLPHESGVDFGEVRGQEHLSARSRPPPRAGSTC